MEKTVDKILAIDFGTKRIGLAVNHHKLAVPVRIIEYKDQAQAIKAIAGICQQRSITQIVIGLSEQKMAEKTRQFGQDLASTVSADIEYFDETLSSAEVKKRLQLKKKPLPKYIDHYAAAYILEEWLAVKSKAVNSK